MKTCFDIKLFKNLIEWNHFSWIIILGCKWTLKIVFMNTFEENNPWFYYTHNTSLSVLCRQYIRSVVGVLIAFTTLKKTSDPYFQSSRPWKKIEFKSRGIFMITSLQTRHLRDLGTAHYSQNCLISSKTFSKRRFDLQIRVNLRKKTWQTCYVVWWNWVRLYGFNVFRALAPAWLAMLHCDWLNVGKAGAPEGWKNLKGLGFCI